MFENEKFDPEPKGRFNGRLSGEKVPVNDQAALQLLQQLVDIPSITGDEFRVGEAVSRILSDLGYTVERQKVESQRFNILAKDEQSPELLFSTHLDTVAPFFSFSRKRDILYGRGVCDAKGCLVAMIAAAQRLAGEGLGRVGLLFLVGEEVDSSGAKKATQLSLRPNYIVVGEPTESQLAVGQKGVLVFRMVSEGVAGHSAYPESGKSAIDPLIRLFAAWQTIDWGRTDSLGESTLNIGTIEGGIAPNVIPDKVSAEGIFRVATSLSEIKERVHGTLVEGIRFDVLSEAEPLKLHSLPDLPRTVVSFGSDAPHLKKLGQVLLCGPGSIEFAHKPDEQLAVEDFLEGIKRYTEIGRRLLRE